MTIDFPICLNDFVYELIILAFPFTQTLDIVPMLNTTALFVELTVTSIYYMYAYFFSQLFIILAEIVYLAFQINLISSGG